MYKSQKLFDKTVRLFVYIATGIQTLLGLIWFAMNITVYKPNILSENYIQASKSLVVDDYMGILYALFLRLFGWTHNSIGINIPFLYLTQLILVLISAFVLVNAIFARRLSRVDKLVVSVLATFNPLSLQISCQIGRGALLLTFFALFVAGVVSVIRNINWKGMGKLSCAALAITFLNYECAYLLIAALVILAVIMIKKNGKVSLAMLAVSLLVGAGIVVNGVVAEPYAYMRGQRSFESVMFQRFAWPDMMDVKEQVEDLFSIDVQYESANACKSVENLYTSLMYKIEMSADYTRVSDFYLNWALLQLSIDTKVQVRRLAVDLILGFIGPASIPVVYIFKISNTLIADALTGFVELWYKGFLCYISLFISFFYLSLALSIMKLIKSREIKAKRKYVVLWIGINGFTSMFVAFWAGRGFDYRNLTVSSLVTIVMVAGFLLTEKEKI